VALPARVSIITIGVADVARSVAFYQRLGWERCSSSMDEIAWFRTADSYLGIFGWSDLAEMVDEGLDLAIAAGATLLKPGTDLPFGYGGYFADPDGHVWEVCYNPGFPIGADGRITID
jgi:predicted lactoylglutathione lyase